MTKLCLICINFYRACMTDTIDDSHYFDGQHYYTRIQCKEVLNKCSKVNRCIK